MRSTRRAMRWLAIPALFAVPGCGSLGRDSPPLEQYVLGAGRTSPAAAPSQGEAGMRIGLRRIEVASYLATPPIVVRQGANRIIVSDFHRWGEDLGHGINREVARHLAGAAAIGGVDVAPWAVRARHDYLVQLHVTHFEGVTEPLAAQGAARMLASWQIIRPVDGAVLARGETDYERTGWRVGDYPSLVLLLDEGLDALAGDVLTCLERVHASAPPPIANAEPPRALACGSAAAGSGAD